MLPTQGFNQLKHRTMVIESLCIKILLSKSAMCRSKMCHFQVRLTCIIGHRSFIWVTVDFWGTNCDCWFLKQPLLPPSRYTRRNCVADSEKDYIEFASVCGQNEGGMYIWSNSLPSTCLSEHLLSVISTINCPTFLRNKEIGKWLPPKNGLFALQTPRTSRLSTFYYCQVVNRAWLRLLSTYILV